MLVIIGDDNVGTKRNIQQLSVNDKKGPIEANLVYGLKTNKLRVSYTARQAIYIFRVFRNHDAI